LGAQIYQPPGPVSEALASYYVRHVVQSALDRAFTLAEPADSAAPQQRHTAGQRQAPE